jgi:hypothetical protein
MKALIGRKSAVRLGERSDFSLVTGESVAWGLSLTRAFLLPF